MPPETRTELVIRYDVTSLTDAEIEAVEDEARAIAENKDRHPAVDVVWVGRAWGPPRSPKAQLGNRHRIRRRR